MNPASITKLVTTYAALDLLGPTFTWSTPVYVDGPIATACSPATSYIKGQGDPKLVIERLWLLLRRVQAAGMRTHRRRHRAGPQRLRGADPDPAAFDGEPLRPYNVAPDALW